MTRGGRGYRHERELEPTLDRRRGDESAGSLVDDVESVLEVLPLGDLVDVGDFQHARRGWLVGASLHFSRTLPGAASTTL